MPPKRPRSPTPPPSPSPSTIHISPPLTDRSSTFIGAFSPTAPLSSLQSLPRFATATHKIAAWRIPSTQTTISGSPKLDAGFDDDGERYGGKTLLKLLEEEGVRGVCMVARWFGGVMLGPVRFEHLRRCARGAVGVWRMKECEGDGGEGEGKRVKVGETEWEMEVERDRLIRELPERDESIRVLRGLLAGKNGREEVVGEAGGDEKVVEEGKGEARDGKQGESHEAVPATPTRMTPAYEKMPLEALRKLEKVRDATIGWILKQIEDAEQKGKAQNGEEKEAG